MSSSGPTTQIALLVAVLLATQIVMLVYTKRVTSVEKLPLSLCLAQFTLSALLSGVGSLSTTGIIPFAPRVLMNTIVPLSFVWTSGFVLFNMSASLMSPAMVSLVRCMEPLATGE